MKAAYADPPYMGCARKHYGKLHEAAGVYDTPQGHADLIARLEAQYDCWALSLHEPSLRAILGMCPDGVRVAAWVKPFACFKPGVQRAWTWEPVIFKFSRPRAKAQDMWRDHISASIAMKRGFPGAKPDAFAYWLFEGLNLRPDDEFDDLFPGSGAIGEGWEKWKRAQVAPEQMELSP